MVVKHRCAVTTQKFICLSYLIDHVENNDEKYWSGGKTQLGWMNVLCTTIQSACWKLFWRCFNSKCTCNQDKWEDTEEFIKMVEVGIYFIVGLFYRWLVVYGIVYSYKGCPKKNPAIVNLVRMVCSWTFSNQPMYMVHFRNNSELFQRAREI